MEEPKKEYLIYKSKMNKDANYREMKYFVTKVYNFDDWQAPARNKWSKRRQSAHIFTSYPVGIPKGAKVFNITEQKIEEVA